MRPDAFNLFFLSAALLSFGILVATMAPEAHRLPGAVVLGALGLVAGVAAWFRR